MTRRRKSPSPPRTVDEIKQRLLGSWGRQDGYLVKETRNETKRYRCPWCEGWVAAGTVHIVAYPEGEPDERRHYHRACWRGMPRR